MKKTVLITGASRGIGKELAEIFAAQGYRLLLVAKETTELEEVQLNLQKRFKSEIKILTVDLNQTESVNAVNKAFADEFPQLDILINNAGFGVAKEFQAMEVQEITSLVEVNITALTKLTHLILPHMLAKKSGKILNVASIAAFMPGPYMSVYYATKAYVLSFSLSLYEECKRSNISISTLCPGITRTAFMTESGLMNTSLGSHFIIRMMTPKAVADVAYKGLMNNKRVIIPGVLNRLNVFFMWLMPSKLVGKVIALLEKPRSA